MPIVDALRSEWAESSLGDPVAVDAAIRRDLADAADVILANVEFISDRPLDEDGEDGPARTRKRNDKTKSGRTE